MTAFLWKHKLTYVSIPKVASTSLKEIFFKVENNRPFEKLRVNGKLLGPHHFYKSYTFDKIPHDQIKDHKKLAVVRDPVRRLLSCYSNIVVHHKTLSQQKAGPALLAAGLQHDPDLTLF